MCERCTPTWPITEASMRLEERLDLIRERMQRNHDVYEAFQRRREFIARCEPLVKIMVDIRNMQPMRYLIAEGRHIEPEILWMPGSKETYDLCQQMIDHIREQYLPGGG